jgi:hypothetical protein
MNIYNNEGIYIYNVKVLFNNDNNGSHKFYNLTVVNKTPVLAYDLCRELWKKYNKKLEYNRMNLVMKSKDSIKSEWLFDGLNIDLL